MGSQDHTNRLSCSGPAIQLEAGAAVAQDKQPVVAWAGGWKAESFSSSSYRGERHRFNVGFIMHIILFVWTEVSWLSLTFFGPIFWSQDRSRAELVPVAEKETSFALKLNASHIQVEKVSWHNMGRGFTKTAKQRNSSQYRFKMLWTTFAFHEVHEATVY